MSHCPMELQCLVHGFEEQNLKTAWQLDAASAEKNRDLGDVQRLVSTQNYSTNISLKIHPKFQVAEENMFNSARYGVCKKL